MIKTKISGDKIKKVTSESTLAESRGDSKLNRNEDLDDQSPEKSKMSNEILISGHRIPEKNQL